MANGYGNRMKTTRGRKSARRTTPAARRRTTPAARRRVNGTGARGLWNKAGSMGRGGVRRATTRRPGPVMRRGRTTPIMNNRGPARGVSSSGQGSHGYRGINTLGQNI